MQGAIIYRWSGARPGREAGAVASMKETTANLSQLQADGRISDFAWYLATQSGPQLLVVRGEMEQLSDIRGQP